MKNNICKKRKKLRTIEKRFWGKVDKKSENECWEWTGAIGSTGYGNFWADKKCFNSPRYSYILHHGQIKHEDFVLHKCDNRKCVNPCHLFLGTQRDNMDDMISKNRQQIGIKHWNALINDNIVKDIRNLHKNMKITYRKISEYLFAKYKIEVQPNNIGQIILRKRWKHI